MRLLVSYLEAFAPPPGPPPAPIPGARVARETLAPEPYLALYRAVGTAVSWDERLRQSPAELAALLVREDFVLYVLRLEGRPVGLCEFDAGDPKAIELVHFGLVPELQRQGLGNYLLRQALAEIWGRRPDRVWLHTDTNDGPGALPLYRQLGFTLYDQRFEDFPD